MSNKAKKRRERHDQRLQEVDAYLAACGYHQALEMMRPIIHNLGLPAEVRAPFKAREIQALLGLERYTEAFLAAGELEHMIHRHRLWRAELQYQDIMTQARQIREPP